MTLAVLLSLFSTPLLAAELTHRFHFEGFAQERQYNDSGTSHTRDFLESYALIDESVEWTSKNWYFEIKPQIRAVQSPAVTAPFPGAVTAATSRRLLNTVRLLNRSEDRDVYFDLDRLNLRYQVGAVEIYGGRRPVSLGVLRFFPVWNKLTLPLVFRPGPEWVENPDSIGASTQFGNIGARAFAARGNHAGRDDLMLGEFKYFGNGFELQSLVGSWWQHTALGLAATVDWNDRALRLETLYISADATTPALVQFGAGVETALNAKWTLVMEGFYQNLGYRKSAAGYPLLPQSRFMLLESHSYFLPHVLYQWSGSWRIGGGGLLNIEDPSFVGLMNADYIWSDSVSLEFKAKWPIGGPGSEFTAHRWGASATVFATVIVSI